MSPFPHRPSSFAHAGLAGTRRRGVVLIIVLSFLVLISILVVAFLSSITTESNSAVNYSNEGAVKQLADSAVQLAIGQITEATRGKDDNGPLAWASQPGMIRTYGTDGKARKYYKLYSSNPLIVSGTSFDLAAEQPDPEWNTSAKAGLFADLNSPIKRGQSALYFPIVDPRAKAATATQSVEGFDYKASVGGVVLPSASSGSANDQRLPMPLRWLYVLQDGKLAVPDSSNNGVVTFTANTPSKANPIVGRMAFWTDDETSKINLNTASEGTFWDRPWANTTTEQKLSTSIPAQNEFQRYPGHPAMTSLSTVFGPVLPSGTTLKTYYDLAPRIQNGGTEGGTIDNVASGFTSPINSDGDRLYASTDELLFKANSADPDLRETNLAAIDQAVLQKAKFFITAQSRAPELNLFGQPRMTLWPLQSEKNKRNAKDRLIAFCSEIGGEPYYFQRHSAYTSSGQLSSSQDPAIDWDSEPRNQKLYNYLERLTSQPIPGIGGKFDTKYPSTRKQLLTEMFDMMRSGINSYGTPIAPGDPSYNYAPKQGDPGEGQIVPLEPGNGTRGFGRFATITEAALLFYRSNNTVDGSNVPQAPQIRALIILEPFTPTPGLPTWSPNVHYVISGLNPPSPTPFQIGVNTDGTEAPSKAYAPLQFLEPTSNWVTGRVGFSGYGNNTAGNTTAFLGLKAAFRYAANVDLGVNGTDGTKSIPASGVTPTDFKKQYPFVSSTVGLPIDATTFDFSGGDMTIQIYAGATASPGPLLQTIHMHFPEAKGLPIPTTKRDGGFYDLNNRIASAAVPGKDSNKEFRTRLIMGGPLGDGTSDVVRSVEARPDGPAKGDLRVYAALKVVPDTYFQPSEGYQNPAIRFSHSLRDGAYSSDPQFGYDAASGGLGNSYGSDAHAAVDTYGRMSTATLSGFLVPQTELSGWMGSGAGEYRIGSNPAVPRGLTAALNSDGASGDWDNMTGTIEDGPYINKPDEGNSDTISNFTSIGGAIKQGTVSGGYYSRGLSRATEGLDYRVTSEKTFSPNRQVSSAVMFGSLPTGIDPANAGNQKPWQTLLFAANPAAGPTHPGYGSPASGPPYTTPPDHLMLDLFHMPIVEPYAISEPLATAGKINMNYQLMPFTYITRSTGVRAVLKSTRMMAIPTRASTAVSGSEAAYKEGNVHPFELRYEINPDESTGTLKAFENRFQAGDLFRSASEICGIYLVPKKIAGKTYPAATTEPTYSTVADWWTSGGPGGKGFQLTGDNLRERPYGDLYPRLTTKSNTYTVHVWVQTLKKVPSTPEAQWVEGKDQVSGEYRGATTVERYIDAANPNLPDFATDASASAEDFYKIRTLKSTTFIP